MALLDVRQEVVRDLCWDNVADILRLAVFERLEGDANTLVVLAAKRGPAAIPRINRRVDLDGEELAAAVDVLLHVDPGDDTLRDREVVAADGEADDRHLVLQRWQPLRELDRRYMLPKLGVGDGEEREVALAADRDHLRDVLGRRRALLHLDDRKVVDAVSIREDALAFDDETGGGGGGLAAHLPRKAVMRLRVRHE